MKPTRTGAAIAMIPEVADLCELELSDFGVLILGPRLHVGVRDLEGFPGLPGGVQEDSGAGLKRNKTSGLKIVFRHGAWCSTEAQLAIEAARAAENVRQARTTRAMVFIMNSLSVPAHDDGKIRMRVRN